MPQITYTDEFKCDAVALVASGIPQKQVAKDMGMAKTTLFDKVKKYGLAH